MKISILSSGSTGNAAVISHGEQSIMIDAGLSSRATMAALYKAGVNPASIIAILLTHNHADHTAGALSIADSLRIPVIGTFATLGAFPWGSGVKMLATPEDSFPLGPFEVTRIPVSHDDADPSGFIIECESDPIYFGNAGRRGRRLGWFTDLGTLEEPEGLGAALDTCDALFLEANHDVEMLVAGPYEWAVRQRILGPLGHLSNSQVCRWILNSFPDRLDTLILGHLSESANSPELLRKEVSSALDGRPVELLVVPCGGTLQVDCGARVFGATKA